MTYNPTDIETNPDSGYSSDDFNSSGNFLKFFGRDSSFVSMMMFSTMGGALPFIFQPDGNNNSPDQFALCRLDQESLKFTQVAPQVYNVNFKIMEVW